MWWTRLVERFRIGRSSPHTEVSYRQSAQLEVQKRRQSVQRWEPRLWELYRRVPELRQAVNYKASAVSRVRLFLGKVTEDGTEPEPVEETPENTDLFRPVHTVLGGILHRPDHMRKWSRLLNVAGQAYVTAVLPTAEEANKHGIPRQWIWSVLSTKDRGTVTGKTLKLAWRTPRGKIFRDIAVDGDGGADVPEDVIYIHDWLGDPECDEEPDSAARGVEEPAETLMNYSDALNAAALSRIAVNGVLVVSDDISVPGVDTEKIGNADPVTWAMMQKGTRDMQERRSAKARWPLMLRTSSERPPSEQMHLQEFDTGFDAKAIDVIDKCIERIAVGMDSPVEVVSGVSDTNHWNALFIGQDGVRVHIGPEVTHMARVLTDYWLWRYYRETLKRKDWSEFVLWWDASALTQDPDRSATMLALYETAPEVLATGTEVRNASGLPPLTARPPAIETTAVVNGSRRRRRNGSIPGIAPIGSLGPQPATGPARMPSINGSGS